MHFLPAGAASAPAHPQRDSRLQRASRASVVFLLVPPSESRSPPALITVWIVRASHRSSSSELLIFSLRSRARARAHSARFPAGRMTCRYRRNCRHGYRILRRPIERKLTTLHDRLTTRLSWKSKSSYRTDRDQIARRNICHICQKISVICHRKKKIKII